MPIQYHESLRTSAAISAWIEEQIRDGTYGPGAHLPTVRALAEQLRVSPATVAAAYRDLGARGMVVAAGRLGTRVAHQPPVIHGSRPQLPADIRDLASGNPDPQLLPLLQPALRRLKLPTVLYGYPGGDPELLELGRQRLAEDGVDATHLTVVGGALDGLERALSAHLQRGDRVGVEEPGYPGVHDLLRALGLVPRPVRVDDEGMLPDELESCLASGISAVLVTPRAQNPYGSATSAVRAAALGPALGRYPGVLLVEDDHAGLIAGVPLHSLAGSGTRHWAHIRSLSKSLGPDLRLALLAGDATTVSRVEGRRVLGTGWVSHVLQRLAVEMWTEPRTRPVLDRAAAVYRDRREALLSALASRGQEAHGASGFNVWVPVSSEEATVTGLYARGWAVQGGERFRLGSGRGIRVCVATLQPEEAVRFAADLADVSLGGPASRLA